MTFDDVVANFDAKEFDIIDAQTKQEYDGFLEGAIFGHIRTAINIPPEELLNFESNMWLLPELQREIFHQHGLSLSRPVIVYCGTSMRATLVWSALQRLRVSSAIYFGSWPEWVIRAPDYLKVIPNSNIR